MASLAKIKTQTYLEYIGHNGKRVPRDYWSNKKNVKIYMDWLAKREGYTTMEDFYKIKKDTFKNNFGGGLLTSNNQSPTKILFSVYPNYNWLEWKFHCTPRGYWDDKRNQKKYMEWLKHELGYTTMEDWYKISQEIINNNYGSGLISSNKQGYNSSPGSLLKAVYPNYNWLDWKFVQTGKNYWKNKDNQKKYVEWLKHELGYTTMEDWYKVTQKDLANNYGSGLLNPYYGGSPSSLLKAVYPNYNWLAWKFTIVSDGYWKKKNNQKKYMEWLKDELGYTTMEDWYKVTQEIINNNYGSGLIQTMYKNCYSTLLKSLYPNHNWLEWKFGCVPNGYWKKKNNQKKYMTWLKHELGYTTMEDWYKLTQKDLSDNYGCGLLANYNCCYSKVLKSLYPNYNWLEWKFTCTPNGYWKKKNNVKKYMEWLKHELGYTTMEDWYKLTQETINTNYGGGLISRKKWSSVKKILKSLYPNYDWLEWKFGCVSSSYWKKKINVKKYMTWLKDELGYTTMEDWYKLTQKDVRNNCGSGLISGADGSVGSHVNLVISVYTNYPWVKSKFNYNKTEKIIHEFLLNNIYNLEITNNNLYQYFTSWCKNPDTGRCLPYDFYIELANGKKIIIECDGEQHYTENSHFHRNDRMFEKLQDRDIFKMNKALENNVSIIRVHQEEVYNDTINWERELTDAINEIKNENEATIKLLGCLSDKVCWDLKLT